jgi:hypothetical protein
MPLGMPKFVSLALVAVLAASMADAAPTPAQRCSAAKMKATAKKATAKIKCHEKAMLKGVAVDPLCLAKAETKFTDAFARAELKGGCATVGDAAALEAEVDVFVGAVVGALTPPVSFAAVVQPIFSSNCTSCHAGAFPASGLSLEVGAAYANIVNVASTQAPAFSLVAPTDAANSYLYQKITNAPGIIGVPMPFGSYPMASGDIAAIEAWINEGALNN